MRDREARDHAAVRRFLDRKLLTGTQPHNFAPKNRLVQSLLLCVTYLGFDVDRT